MNAKRIITCCMMAALIVFAGLDAHAAYPDKTIKIYVPANAGGGQDLFTRQLAPLLAAELGQTLVVVNQPGGAGNLAANTVLKAAPDGYTILIANENVFGMNFKTLNVNFQFEDIIPISEAFKAYMGIYTHPDHGWKTLSDAIKTAKAENKTLKFGYMDPSARGIIEEIAKSENISFAMVPQTAAPNLLTGVMGKHLDLAIIGNGMTDSILAGKTVLLGSLSSGRFPQVEEVPTIHEQGYKVSVLDSTIFLAAPKGTPEEALKALENAMLKISQTEEYQKALDLLRFVKPKEFGREAAKRETKAIYDNAMSLEINTKQ